MFHETYCRIVSSQHTDLKPVSLQRGGIKLHGSVANMSREKISLALRVHLLCGHASRLMLKYSTVL
jgi:hypothetical protein